MLFLNKTLCFELMDSGSHMTHLVVFFALVAGKLTIKSVSPGASGT